MLFVESPGFTQRVTAMLEDAALAQLQQLLMADPGRGKE